MKYPARACLAWSTVPRAGITPNRHLGVCMLDNLCVCVHVYVHVCVLDKHFYSPLRDRTLKGFADGGLLSHFPAKRQTD